MDRGDRRELSGQLRRSGMFIAPASKQNRHKPHRGGMVRWSDGVLEYWSDGVME